MFTYGLAAVKKESFSLSLFYYFIFCPFSFSSFGASLFSVFYPLHDFLFTAVSKPSQPASQETNNGNQYFLSLFFFSILFSFPQSLTLFLWWPDRTFNFFRSPDLPETNLLASIFRNAIHAIKRKVESLLHWGQHPDIFFPYSCLLFQLFFSFIFFSSTVSLFFSSIAFLFYYCYFSLSLFFVPPLILVKELSGKEDKTKKSSLASRYILLHAVILTQHLGYIRVKKKKRDEVL